MPHALFISDLHLQEEAPSIVEAFQNFMRERAPSADALYVLGDFFETWIGDDDESAFNTQLIVTLRNLVDKGTPVYFIRGNRDFLIGKRFAEKTGATLLPDPSRIELYGKPVLLSHGDRLCTLDLKHQAYRRKTEKRWLQKLFLSVPLKLRRKLAKRLREKSKKHNLTAPRYITDVTHDEVIRLMKANDIYFLIHGHTHRPGIHDVTVDGQPGKRIVLGAWHDGISYLTYFNDGQFALENRTVK